MKEEALPFEGVSPILFFGNDVLPRGLIRQTALNKLMTSMPYEA
jgi:hypothetical protein